MAQPSEVVDDDIKQAAAETSDNGVKLDAVSDASLTNALGDVARAVEVLARVYELLKVLDARRQAEPRG